MEGGEQGPKHTKDIVVAGELAGRPIVEFTPDPIMLTAAGGISELIDNTRALIEVLKDTDHLTAKVDDSVNAMVDSAVQMAVLASGVSVENDPPQYVQGLVITNGAETYAFPFSRERVLDIYDGYLLDDSGRQLFDQNNGVVLHMDFPKLEEMRFDFE